MDVSTVAVAGGGLAGLRAAAVLADEGADVFVFEKEPTVGGRVRTSREGPYRFDRGFQVLFTSYPELRAAVDLDELDLRPIPAGATICRPNHRSTIADPRRELGSVVETLFSRDITMGDKYRVLQLTRKLEEKSVDEIFTGPDQTIAEYLQEYGFSRKFIANFAAPFYGGITLDRSLQTSKRVFEFTFKMLAIGDAAVPADGMGALPLQLADTARQAGATIETNSEVESVDADGDGVTVTVDGKPFDADAAIVATDPPTSAQLTGVEAIPTDGHGCITQYLTLPGDHPFGADPRIHLNAASEMPNQMIPISAVAPEYGPDDELLVSATSLDPNIDEDAHLDAVQTTLESWYPEHAFESLELQQTVRVPFAQFAQPPGIHEELPSVHAPAGQVYLAGDYTENSSINGALKSGRRAAMAALGYIQER